mmetsp:Transcript_10451/g.29891  ORF Transcript_10451/g.29891 Transcript_10451/m.29891 type:complete len:294 (-) Transcript_10451:683-1564(-)
MDQRSRCGSVPAFIILQLYPTEAVGVLFRNERCRRLRTAEPWVPAEIVQEACVVRKVRGALDDISVQGLLHAVDTRVPSFPVGHKLGNHGVVVRADLHALEEPAVHSHRLADVKRGGTLGFAVLEQGSVRRQEATDWILSVDSRLQGPAVNIRRQLLCGQRLRQRLTGGDPQHLLHQINPPHELGNWVFDLESRVHLQKIKILFCVREELDRAGGVVAHSFGQHRGLLAHERPGLGSEQSRGRLLQDLLVAPLDRALALWEADHFAMFVSNELDLNVVWLFNELFDEKAVVAK